MLGNEYWRAFTFYLFTQESRNLKESRKIKITIQKLKSIPSCMYKSMQITNTNDSYNNYERESIYSSAMFIKLIH